MTNKTSRKIEKLILWLVVLVTALLFMSCKAKAQDSTTVKFNSPSGYESILLEVPVSFMFQDTTKAIEGVLRFDDDRAILVGFKVDIPGAFAEMNGSIDSVHFAVSWPNVITAQDSLITFKFMPTKLGSFMYNLAYLQFDERIPANDGVTFVQGQTEIYPFDTFPGFVDTENYVEKITACDWIRNFTMLRSDVGDVTGNGDVSAFDASTVLSYVVGKITSFPSQDSTITILPSFCDE